MSLFSYQLTCKYNNAGKCIIHYNKVSKEREKILLSKTQFCWKDKYQARCCMPVIPGGSRFQSHPLRPAWDNDILTKNKLRKIPSVSVILLRCVGAVSAVSPCSKVKELNGSSNRGMSTLPTRRESGICIDLPHCWWVPETFSKCLKHSYHMPGRKSMGGRRYVGGPN